MASPKEMEATRRMVLVAAAACEDKKAEETRILELDAADAGFTDYFLITSGTNERQTQAIADEIELQLKKQFGAYPNSVEGRRQGEWVLMDYVDFVVHIFVAEKRAFYDIERLRKSAKPMDAEQLKTALAEKTAAVRRQSDSKAAPAKKVPAKESEARSTAARKRAGKKSTPAKKRVLRRTGAEAAKKSPAKKSAKRVPAKRVSAKRTRKRSDQQKG